MQDVEVEVNLFREGDLKQKKGGNRPTLNHSGRESLITETDARVLSNSTSF